MKEYIYQIEDDESDESEVFIGWIRKQGHELIRCKDCKYHRYDEKNGVPYCVSCGYFWYGWKDDDFCSWAVRKEE